LQFLAFRSRIYQTIRSVLDRSTCDAPEEPSRFQLDAAFAPTFGLTPDEPGEERPSWRFIPLRGRRAVNVQFGIVFGGDLRGSGERDEPEVAAFVAGRAVVEMQVGTADLAVLRPVALVLGLEVDDSHLRPPYPVRPHATPCFVSAGLVAFANIASRAWRDPTRAQGWPG